MDGPCQTIGRAEFAAVDEVLVRELRPMRVRVDNAWVVSGMRILLAGHPPNPLREHIDVWTRVWEHLQKRSRTARVQKVQGHLDDALIAAGRRPEDERKGNDLADDSLKWASGGMNRFGRRRVRAPLFATWLSRRIA